MTRKTPGFFNAVRKIYVRYVYTSHISYPEIVLRDVTEDTIYFWIPLSFLILHLSENM